MKRTERKQLKEDELATGLSRFLKWAKQHEKEFMALAIGLAVILVVVVAVNLVINYQRSREASYLSEVLTLRAELDKKPENLEKLQQMTRKTRYGRIASLILASYYLEKNEVQKAEEILAAVKDKGRDLIHYQIVDLYAQIKIKKGQYDEAINLYRQIEKEKPKSYPLDVILFHLAEAYEKKGEIQNALQIYRDLQANYQNTYFGYQAALKAMQLESSR
ncbi:MAG: tetratricopeptide repeat protein [Candidatus Aminicenantes bacterium]|nr:tetratricopeptide repeat protein [Candidatus Aminicenantes bacterium]